MTGLSSRRIRTHCGTLPERSPARNAPGARPHRYMGRGRGSEHVQHLEQHANIGRLACMKWIHELVGFSAKAFEVGEVEVDDPKAANPLSCLWLLERLPIAMARRVVECLHYSGNIWHGDSDERNAPLPRQVRVHPLQAGVLGLQIP